MRQDPSAPITPNTTSGTLEVCQACGRSQPFTAAILMGLPLAQICTCAIEQRANDRFARAIAHSAPVIRAEGH